MTGILKKWGYQKRLRYVSFSSFSGFLHVHESLIFVTSSLNDAVGQGCQEYEMGLLFILLHLSYLLESIFFPWVSFLLRKQMYNDKWKCATLQHDIVYDNSPDLVRKNPMVTLSRPFTVRHVTAGCLPCI
eukprot:TRINITY_DN6900_c5_g2_i1.p1 TRINITY_DN6900_c5_g2~~TRINITY_DN6900_c5_g2_i1.p1  ORF type:complete len:130 (+),score=7.33 TRINITY_DN6900_c5_g2_i1:27-416(+)